jgi:uncharacterized protein YcnI
MEALIARIRPVKGSTMIARLCLAVTLAAVSTAASAHITFAEPQAPAGSYYAGSLRVTHGCGASPTVSIRVAIPEGVDTARPQPKAGWTLRIEHAPLAHPFASESGTMVTERVTAITWTGNLPADEFDQFGLMLKLPAKVGPLYFPTRQTCASGENGWVNVPATPDAWHATKLPAPMLIVTAAPGSAPMDMGPMHMGH